MNKMYRIIILLIIVIIAIFIEVFIDSSDLVIFENNTILYYRNDRILKIAHPKKINNRYNFNKFLVYDGNNFIEGYINFLNEDNYTYSEVYKSDYSKAYIYPLIACTSGLNLKITEATIDNEYTQEEKDNIKKILLNNNLSEEYTSFSKSVTDEITIYNVNNFQKDSDEYYNIVFSLNKKGNYSIIDKSIYNKSTLSVKKISFFGQIDIDIDGEDEVVITKTEGDDKPIYYYFYKYDSKEGTLTEIK